MSNDCKGLQNALPSKSSKPRKCTIFFTSYTGLLGHNLAFGTVTSEGREVILKNDALHNKFKTWVSEPALMVPLY